MLGLSDTDPLAPFSKLSEFNSLDRYFLSRCLSIMLWILARLFLSQSRAVPSVSASIRQIWVDPVEYFESVSSRFKFHWMPFLINMSATSDRAPWVLETPISFRSTTGPFVGEHFVVNKSVVLDMIASDMPTSALPKMFCHSSCLLWLIAKLMRAR